MDKKEVTDRFAWWMLDMLHLKASVAVALVEVLTLVHHHLCVSLVVDEVDEEGIRRVWVEIGCKLGGGGEDWSALH
jgi:hypothetical protein